MAMVSSCKEDEVKPAEIKIDPTEVSIDSVGGSAAITLTSNRDWTVSVAGGEGTSDTEWLTVSPASSKASSEGVTVTIEAASNYNPEASTPARSAVVTFQTTEEASATLTVTQAAYRIGSGDEPVDPTEPSVETGDAVADSEDPTTVTISGSYTYEGEEEITEVGVVCRLPEDEETEYLAAESVSSPFEVVVSGLSAETQYEYYAYVKMGDEYYEGEVKSFTTSSIDDGVLTISELASALSGLEDGASLSGLGEYAEGIVSANNGAGNNFYKALSVVDGSGEPGSGVYLYDESINEGFEIGDKVRISLANAKLEIYSGLYEIVWESYDNEVEVISSGNSFTVPELSVSEILTNDYVSMYVTVTDLTSEGISAGTTFASSNSVNFKSQSGESLAVRTTGYADWADEEIMPGVEAPMSGVASIFNGTVQLTPIQMSDVESYVNNLSITISPAEGITETGAVISGYYEYTGSGTVTGVGAGYKPALSSGDYTFVEAASTDNPVRVELTGLTAETSYYAVLYVEIDGVRTLSEQVAFMTATSQLGEISISQLVAGMKNLSDGASLSSLGTYAKGICTATNMDGNNIPNAVIIEDGTGEPNSGVYVYTPTTELAGKLLEGDEVLMDLSTAKLSIYNGLRQITWDNFTMGQTIKWPSTYGLSYTLAQVTVDQVLTGEYQGMYVEVTDLTSSNIEPGTTFASANSINFSNTAGTELAVRTRAQATWANKYIYILPEGMTEEMKGVASVYNGTVQLLPVFDYEMTNWIDEDYVPPVGGNAYEWILKNGDLGTSANPGYGAPSLGNPPMAWGWTFQWATGEAYLGFNGGENGRGVQIGSAAKPVTNFQLTSTVNTDITYQTIVLNASQANDANASVMVLGGESGTEVLGDVSLTGDATEYEFQLSEPISGGDITFIFDVPGKKAIYVKSVVLK